MRWKRLAGLPWRKMDWFGSNTASVAPWASNSTCSRPKVRAKGCSAIRAAMEGVMVFMVSILEIGSVPGPGRRDGRRLHKLVLTLPHHEHGAAGPAHDVLGRAAH